MWQPPSRKTLAASLFIALIGAAGCVPGPQTTELSLPQQSVDTGPPLSISLNYLRAGTEGGTRVIFVHGTPGRASGWADYLENVPKGREYFAVDRPGFGGSLPQKAFVSLEDQARSLAPLLLDDPAQDRPVILVGHSLGGPIVAKAAVLFPDQIDGLVIAAGSLDPSLEKIHPLQYVGEWWPFVWLLPKDLKHANRELLGLKSELQILDRRLGEISQPVTIIHGTEDGLVPYANVPYMEERIRPQAIQKIVTLEGVNHFLPWNSKEVIDQAIDDLITQARQSGAD